jgi:hypothetical protein
MNIIKFIYNWVNVCICGVIYDQYIIYIPKVSLDIVFCSYIYNIVRFYVL